LLKKKAKVILRKDAGMLPHKILLVNKFIYLSRTHRAASLGLEVSSPTWYRRGALEMEEEDTMEFVEKARIRLEHWIHHSEDHYQEYVSFAKELEDAGKIESARHLKDMIGLTTRSTEVLKKAMKALG